MKNKMKNWIRTLIIWILHIQTARAFQVPLSQAELGSPVNALAAYAEFTHKSVCIRSKEDLYPVQRRMYRIALRTGLMIRCLFFIRTEKRARKVITWLYQNIEINLVCENENTILIKSCYFSHCYDPSVCHIMSSMDKGIFTGIFEGGTLSFSARITENHDFCKASFNPTQR